MFHNQFGQSAKEIIFHKLFLIKIRTIDIYSRGHVELYGMPYTGNKQWDRAYANEIQSIYITIAQMTDYFKQGINFGFTSEDDILEIYDTIHQHLKDFNNKVSRNINFSNIPIEDLNLLSDFASHIYPQIANYRSPESYQRDVITDSGIGSSYFDIDKIFRSRPKSEEEALQKEKEDNYYKPDYQPNIPKAPHLELMIALEERSKYLRQPFPIRR